MRPYNLISYNLYRSSMEKNLSIKFFIIVLKAMLLGINTNKYNRFIKLIKAQDLKRKPQCT